METSTPLVHRMKRLELLNSKDFEYAENLIKSKKIADPGISIIEAGSIQKQIFFVFDGWAVKYKILENGSR